jgi:hypothetical protein
VFIACAGSAPLAGRVGDLLSLEKGKILCTFAILVAVIAGNKVHHVSKLVRLKTIILEVSILQRYPFVQAGVQSRRAGEIELLKRCC